MRCPKLSHALAVALVGALSACAHTPPVLKSTEVAPPAVPAPNVAPDPMTLGWLRAHQLLRAAERLGMENPALAASAAGVDLTAIDPERPIVVLVGEPKGTTAGELPGMAWLPVSPDSGIGAMLAAMAPGGTIPLAGGTALALNGPDSASPGTKALLEKLAAAPLGTDVEVFVQLHALVKQWGTVIESTLAELEQQMKTLPGPGPKPQPAVIHAYMTWIRDALKRAGSAYVGFAVGTDDLVLDVVTRDQSALSQAWPATASSMPDLAQFTPAGQVRVEMKPDPESHMMDFALNFYDDMLRDLPAQRDRMKKNMNVWRTAPGQVAMSMSFGGERVFHMAGVNQTPAAEKFFAAMVDTARLMADPAVAKAMTQDVVQFQLTVEENARQVEGSPVTRVTYHMSLGENLRKTTDLEASPAIQAFLAKPMEMEILRLGDYLLYAMNEAPGTLDTMARELMAGKGSQASLIARKREPAGGTMYADLDFAGLANGFVAILPPNQQPAGALLDAKTPPVTLFSYGPTTMSYTRVNVPQALVKAIQAIPARMRAERGETN
jgi:hypothetical protein